MTDSQTDLKNFQEILDVQFADPTLLRRALTHRSFVNEAGDKIRDNERLEFLGDAVLDFLIADLLFTRFPDISEGDMTQLRSALVRADSLARLATGVNLGNFLIMGKGEELSGGRERINNLCRGFEAVIGALYVDAGLDAVKGFALPRFIDLLDYILEHSLHLDARSILQERSQADLQFTPIYRLQEIVGPGHDQEFIVEVLVGDIVMATGRGNNKRAAAQDAARVAIESLEAQGWPEAAKTVAEQNQQILSDEEDIAPEPKKRLPDFKSRSKHPRKIQSKKDGKQSGRKPLKRRSKDKN